MFAALQKIITLPLGGCLMVVALLSACQTANRSFEKEKEVDISEVRIKLPDDLYEVEGFKVKKVMVQESGSYRREKILFQGGQIIYDRYFRGGFLAMTKNRLKDRMEAYFDNPEYLTPIETLHLDFGSTYVTSVYLEKAETDEKFSCAFSMSNVGMHLELDGGLGYPGRMNAQYCLDGRQPKILDEALPWLKKIRINR